jgi:hypothetical protein
VQLVVGGPLAVIGAMFLIAYGIVNDVGGDAACGSSAGCANSVLAYVLLWPGILLVAVGALLVAAALWRTV